MANNAVNKIDRMFLVTDWMTFNKVSSLLTISKSKTAKIDKFSCEFVVLSLSIGAIFSLVQFQQL